MIFRLYNVYILTPLCNCGFLVYHIIVSKPATMFMPNMVSLTLPNSIVDGSCTMMFLCAASVSDMLSDKLSVYSLGCILVMI